MCFLFRTKAVQDAHGGLLWPYFKALLNLFLCGDIQDTINLEDSFSGEVGFPFLAWKNDKQSKQPKCCFCLEKKCALLWHVLSLKKIYILQSACIALCLPHSQVFGWPRDPSNLHLIKQCCITMKWVHHVTLFAGVHKMKTKARTVILWT